MKERKGRKLANYKRDTTYGASRKIHGSFESIHKPAESATSLSTFVCLCTLKN
jgi:hypothetical protein